MDIHCILIDRRVSGAVRTGTVCCRRVLRCARRLELTGNQCAYVSLSGKRGGYRDTDKEAKRKQRRKNFEWQNAIPVDAPAGKLTEHTEPFIRRIDEFKPESITRLGNGNLLIKAPFTSAVSYAIELIVTVAAIVRFDLIKRRGKL